MLKYILAPDIDDISHGYQLFENIIMIIFKNIFYLEMY